MAKIYEWPLRPRLTRRERHRRQQLQKWASEHGAARLDPDQQLDALARSVPNISTTTRQIAEWLSRAFAER